MCALQARRRLFSTGTVLVLMGGRLHGLCPRERAVRMYRTAETKPVIRRMAEELGVHHEALRNWIRQAEADAGERDHVLTTDHVPAAQVKDLESGYWLSSG
ncbi:transposase [Streptomyces sp. NPDC056930]|uniref:transposase n=1 Tax=Streptomyces sp. NPDC056930 TaxID=3345967 RepID=UPI003638546D